MLNKEIEEKKNLELQTTKNILGELENQINIEIKTDDDLMHASELLKIIKNRIKTIEERRKELTKPLNDYVKNLNNEFKLFILEAEEIRKKLETEILKYNRVREERLRIEAEKKRQEELAKLKKEEEKAKQLNDVFGDKNQEIIAGVYKKQHDKLENKEISVSNTIKTEKAITSTRKQWTYEIINENEISKEYCSPDHKKIQKAIKNGIREISGIKIFEKEILITR